MAELFFILQSHDQIAYQNKISSIHTHIAMECICSYLLLEFGAGKVSHSCGIFLVLRLHHPQGYC
jgi:hypothetical protein